MDVVGFAESIGGEMVAGCVIATVDGKRQYLYRDGVWTEQGLFMFQAWGGSKNAAEQLNRAARRAQKVADEKQAEPAKE